MTYTELIIAEAKARNQGNTVLAEKLNCQRWQKVWEYRTANASEAYRKAMLDAGRGRLVR